MSIGKRFVPVHPHISRRTAIQAGAIGLLGLGTNHLEALRDSAHASEPVTAKSVIFIFLSGGLSQHESFDPKPEAPAEVRGEFGTTATRTPGLRICEHLPMLAARSHLWSLCRSLTHSFNEHSQGHMVMLSGRSALPAGFNLNKPQPSDWPSMAAVAGRMVHNTNNLPPAVMLPEVLIHRTGRVIPGQFGGQMGATHDPWVVNASPFNPTTYGAYPEYEFHHGRGAETSDNLRFNAPSLSLPQGLTRPRLAKRLDLVSFIDGQRRAWERDAEAQSLDRYRQQAISLLADPKLRRAFDVVHADARLLERYGNNQFGWSILMGKRLVESGVRLVQINLGNDETWDTHQAAFPNLKNHLLPPMDRAVSALLDDLHESGMLNDTLVVMGSEFGRTPRVFTLPGVKLAGRDHWGAVQSLFFAGGGIPGGAIIGASDKLGASPSHDPQTPENLAATIYQALGIPKTGLWQDPLGRPHRVYHGTPIQFNA